MSVDDFKTSYHRRCMCFVGDYWNSNDDLLDSDSQHLFIRVKDDFSESMSFLLKCIFNYRFVIHLIIHRSEWLKLYENAKNIKTSFIKGRLVTHVGRNSNGKILKDYFCFVIDRW